MFFGISMFFPAYSNPKKLDLTKKKQKKKINLRRCIVDFFD